MIESLDTSSDTPGLPPNDWEAIARQFQLRESQVRATVELLDEGNTVPFITRYRRDRTGGLDEEKIRLIQEVVNKRRQLNERKERILRSIQSQGKLTPDLSQRILACNSLKTLEDLYLPFRPKKQTLATLARQRGLEPLAMQLLSGDPGLDDPDAACQRLIEAHPELTSVSDVWAGIRHILAEVLSERVDLRALVRKALWNGQLVSKRIEHDPDQESDALEADASSAYDVSTHFDDPAELLSHPDDAMSGLDVDDDRYREADLANCAELDSEESESDDLDSAVEAEGSAIATAPTPPDDAASDDTTTLSTDAAASPESPQGDDAKPTSARNPAAIDRVAAAQRRKQSLAEQRRQQRRETRHRKRHKLEQSFKDYFNYTEPVKRLPHYRVLAVNRGERCKVLRVKIQFEMSELKQAAEGLTIAADHPNRELLRDALHVALTRLVVPSIEREIRRELTERAETHAVRVFARNLRKLLLQAPLRGHRVLAIDPGFRSGCKLAALDEFGNLLGHSIIHVIGAADRVQQSRARLAEQIKAHRITVVAIGNGTACRETEQFVANVLAEELADQEVHYLIVNEAGASVYSTSQMGREEFPRHDATVRGAVSIGRRALDPLSELVKIDPASIGVGLYQHDVKAKHLRTSLDAVVESCVNYVGVDVNSASPALLSYVSGLNQLTARRVYEHRQQHGPFRGREQLKQVPGVGESSYVQAAGFLKIVGGDNPLDGTWIHPESYETAQRVLAEIQGDVGQLVTVARRASVAATPKNESESPAFGAEGAVEINTAATQAEGEAAAPPLASLQSAGELGESVDSSEAIDSVELSDLPSSPVEFPRDITNGQAMCERSDAAPSDTERAATGPASTNDVEDARPSLADQLARIDVDILAESLSVGRLLLQDILASMARPGRDPREDLLPPVFRREVMKLEDLKPGMELSGTVLNVVDFGAFVDIGLSDSGLIHVSRLADRFVSDPHEVVSVGDVLPVWVVDVDEKRRRVSLTAIEPGHERPRPAHQEGSSRDRSAQGPGGFKRRRPRHGTAESTTGTHVDPVAGQQAPLAGGPAAEVTMQGGATHGARPPRGGFRPQRSGGKPSGQRPPQRSRGPYKPKSPPKPVVPITDAMAQGREPMRTFSDLQQFFQRKRQDQLPPADAPPAAP